MLKKKFKKYCNLGALDSPSFITNLNVFINSLNNYQYYAVLFKVPTTDGTFISLYKQVVLDKSIDLEIIKTRLINRINYHESFYEVSSCSTVIAEYFPIYVNIDKPDSKISNIPINIIKNSGIHPKFFSNKYCPLTMDLSKYGVLHSTKTSNNNTIIKIYLLDELRIVIEELDYSYRNIKVFNDKDIKIFEFFDENFGDFFIRNIGDFFY